MNTPSQQVDTPAAQPTALALLSKPHSLRIAVLAGLGAVFLLALIGVIFYFIFVYISKADYKQAETQTNSIISTYNALDTASVNYSQVVRNGSSTDAEVTAKRASYDSANTAYQTAVTSLSSQRALKNKAVKAAYDSFITKNKDFVANNSTFEQTMPMLRTVAVKCTIGTMGNDLSQLVASYDKTFGPCSTAMQGLSSSKDVDAMAVGKKAVSYLADMRTHVVAMQSAYTTKNRATFESEYNIFLNKDALFSTETDTSSVQKIPNSSVAPQNELNHLATVIQTLE